MKLAFVKLFGYYNFEIVYFLKLGIIFLTQTQENLTPIKKLPDYKNFSEKILYSIGSATLHSKSEITLKYVLCVV